MAKKQSFGEEALQAKQNQRKMAKVIVATKNSKGKFAYKEIMVDQDNASEVIKKHRS